MLPLKVVSLGVAVPPRIETSADLAGRIDRSEEWIVSRTGVRSRRIADEPMEVLGARAARAALGEGPPPDLILNASTTPRQLIPDSSVFIQGALGYEGIPSYSIHATCLSFLVALQNAAALLSAGAYRRILIVSSETGSMSRDFAEQESAALIGDGAAAAIVEVPPPGEESALLGWKMRTVPSGASLTEFRGAGASRHPNDSATRREDNLFHMNGPRVYRMARVHGGEVLQELFAACRLAPSDIDLVVPHQASGPGVASYTAYGFPEERIVSIVGEYGNCIAASIPMALTHAVETGQLRRGMRVLVAGTGAGLSLAGAVLRW